MTNEKLKTAMFKNEITHKQAAAKLGINARVFTNKINKRKVNGYEARFKEAEKIVLAAELNINKNDIE